MKMRRLVLGIFCCWLISVGAVAGSDATRAYPTAKSIDGFAGIDCTGVAESTSGFQAALGTVAAALLIPANCTLVLDTVTLPQVVAIFGQGDTSIIKQKNGATGHMLRQLNAGSMTEFRKLKLDGNFQNNGGDNTPTWMIFRLEAAGSSAAQSATVVIDDVTFANGGYADVGTYYAQSSYVTSWFETNTRHYGGAIGYDPGGLGDFFAGSFDGAINAGISGVTIDPQRRPALSTDIGRAGYAFFLHSPTDTVRHLLRIDNFNCNNTGHSANSLAGGCIALHEGTRNAVITNVTSTNAIGQGVNFKADIENLTLSNVMVSDLSASTYTNASVGACVAMNAATTAHPVAGSGMTITNVTCRNTAGNGILIDGRNAATPTQLFSTGTVDGFSIDACSGSAPAISLIDGVALTVRNGSIKNCANSISGAYVGPLTTGPLTISGIAMSGSGAASFDATTTANGLSYNP